MKLYYHKTGGGAEYLTDTKIRNPDGSWEGRIQGAKYVVRIDGDICKDAELSVDEPTKESNGYLECPECGAQHDLTGLNIGRLAMMPVFVHVRGQWPDASEPHNSMLLAESLTAPDTCSGSERLVWIKR